MANVYDNAKKAWVDIPDEELPKAVYSGTHSFEAGTSVPMIDNKGLPIDVPAENAGKAFGFGFQLSTPAAASAAYDRQSVEALKSRMAEAPGSVFGANAINAATMGAANVGARVLGGDAATSAIKAGNEANPYAAGLGTAAGIGVGMLASGGLGAAAEGVQGAEGAATVLGAGTRGAAVAGEMAAGATAKALAPLASTGRIGDALVRVASKTVGGAAEGAYFGLGTGVSEAALGNPDDVVDNIVSGVTMGALIGGAASGAFGALGEGKSAFQKLVTNQVDKGINLVSEAARGVGKAAIKSALAARGESALAAESGALFTPEAEAAMRSPGVTAGMKEAADLSGPEAELNARLKRQSAAVSDELKAESQGVKDEVKARLLANDGDVTAALDGFQQSIIEAGDNFKTYRAAELADKSAVAVEKGRALLNDTLSTLSEKAQSAEEKLFVRNLADSTRARFGNDAQRAGISMADELSSAQEINEYIGQNFKARSPLMQNSTDAFRREVKESFLPKFNDLYGAAYPDATAAKYMTDLRDFTSAKYALQNAIKEDGVTAISPLLTAKSGQVLGKISDLLPDLEKARLAAGNAEKLEQTYKDAFVKFTKAKIANKELGTPIGYAEFKDIVAELTPSKSILDKLDRIKATQDALNTQTLSPIDAAIQMKRALGHDVSDLTALQPHYKTMDLLSKIQNLKREGTGAGMASTGAVVGGFIGGGAGAAVGGAAGKLLAASTKVFNDPARIIRSVQGIQSLANQGGKILDKSIKAATNALLGKTVESLVTRAKIESESADSRRARYNKVRDTIATLQNPQQLQEHIAASTGGLEGAPAIKTAVATKLATGVSYLAQQMPKDPMAGVSILASKSNYTASDSDIAKFMGKVDAVSNPIGVVERIASGRVSQAEIQALKAVHPAIYLKLQASVIDGIMSHGDKLPYERRLQIGQLFNVPTDYSMKPEFIHAMQNNFADKAGRPKGAEDTEKRDYGGRKPKLDTEKAFSALQSTSDSLTYKKPG